MRISDWSSDVCSSDLHILQSNISRGRQKVPIGQSDEDSFAPQILSMTPRQPRIAWNKGGIQPSVQHAGSIRLRRRFLELHLNIGKASLVGVESLRQEAARSEERRVGKAGVITCRYRR